MKRKTKKQKKFPSNFRSIPEWKSLLNWRTWQFWVNFVSLVLFIGIVAAGVNLYKLNRELDKQRKERLSTEKELASWEKIIAKYPNYRDGYFKAALLEYRLKNNTKAKEYVGKVLELDPGFEEGRRLEKVLSSPSAGIQDEGKY